MLLQIHYTKPNITCRINVNILWTGQSILYFHLDKMIKNQPCGIFPSVTLPILFLLIVLGTATSQHRDSTILTQLQHLISIINPPKP